MEVMLDLETMSTAKDAAIVSIGAIRWDREKQFTTDDTFYCIVQLQSAMRSGGKLDGATVLWWLQQNPEARAEFTGNNSKLIETALKEFSEWFREKSVSGIWGNGADFDNVILESAYARSNWTPPWSYKRNRCYRTMAAIFPEIIWQPSGTRHNALADATAQAEHLHRIFEHLRRLQDVN